TTLLQLAAADGIAERTLRRAKKELHVPGDKDGQGAWLWRMPGTPPLRTPKPAPQTAKPVPNVKTRRKANWVKSAKAAKKTHASVRRRHVDTTKHKHPSVGGILGKLGNVARTASPNTAAPRPDRRQSRQRVDRK